MLSVWLIFIFVYDRYRALCGNDFNTPRAGDSQKVHKKLITVTFASFLYSFPRYFELFVTYNDANHHYVLGLTSLIKNLYYMIGYRIIGSIFLYSLVPYILIFAMSSRICFALRRASIARTKMSAGNSTKNDSNSDWLIMILAFRFLISRLPATLLDFIEIVMGYQKFLESEIIMIVLCVSNFFVVLSSVSTFIILFFVSKQFRKFICTIFSKIVLRIKCYKK